MQLNLVIIILKKSSTNVNVNFILNLNKLICDFIKTAKNELNQLVGPGTWESWFFWKSPNEEQKKNSCIKSEIERLLKHHDFEVSKSCPL